MERKLGRAARGSAQNIRVYNRDGWTCVYCRFNGANESGCVYLEMDHLDPRTKKDDDLDQPFDNDKVTACVYCNRLKGGYIPQGTTRDEKLVDAIAHVKTARERACGNGSS